MTDSIPNGPAVTDPVPDLSPDPSRIDQPTSMMIFDRETFFPKAVATKCGLDHEKMSMLEVPNGSLLYRDLLQYAAYFAVDIDTDFSTLQSESEASTEAADTTSNVTGTPRTIKGFNDLSIPAREGPGELRTLWHCPGDGFDPSRRVDFDSESDIDYSDSDDEESEALVCSNYDDDPVEAKKKRDAILESYISLGSLKKKKVEPRIPRYQLGLGFGKVQLGDSVVHMHHCGYGMPVPIDRTQSVRVYRTLILAGKNSKVLKEICAVALKWRTDRDHVNTVPKPGKFNLYRFKTSGGCGDWSNEGYQRSRLPKSVILPDGQLEAIVGDIMEFVGKGTKTWYEAHGLPHRRSYLFHGPPGCGKTSTIRMIAGMFRLNACFLSFTGSDFSNQVLQDALSSLPRRALLVLEDVDVLFNEDRKSQTSSALTFSGMLNALDGLISVDGVIGIFTTNHIERLDPALIRGGRVDRRFEFVHPNHKQMCALFLSFYEDASREVAERFADGVLSRPEAEARSIATLQQHFIYTRKMDAETSVKMLPKFFTAFYPKGGQARNPLYL